MKSELNENFGDEMFITELHGEMNVVTFCYIAASIVFLQCYIPQSTKVRCSWLKKIKITQTAFMLIQNDVQAVAPDGTLYPSTANTCMSSTA